MQLKPFAPPLWIGRPGSISNHVVPFQRPVNAPVIPNYWLILAGLTLTLAGCLVTLAPFIKGYAPNSSPSQSFSASDFARALRRL
jgi:hypothetical protein